MITARWNGPRQPASHVREVQKARAVASLPGDTSLRKGGRGVDRGEVGHEPEASLRDAIKQLLHRRSVPKNANSSIKMSKTLDTI